MRNRDYPLYQVGTFNNLKELINLSAWKYGDNTAFSFEQGRKIKKISYRKFKSDIDSLAATFLNNGFNNSKIALIGENSYEWIVSYFAIVTSGNVVVPLDKELSVTEIRNLINHSDAELIIFANNFLHVAKYLQQNEVSIKQYIDMNDLTELIKTATNIASVSNITINNDSLAALMYTSGTTGAPKGVMLSHRNIATNTMATGQLYEVYDSMLVLPLHHIFGFVGGICVPIHQGSEVFINSGLKNILSDLEICTPTSLSLVPLFIESFYKKIWETAAKKGKDELLKKLIKISNGLLKIGIDVRRKLFKSVLQSFGGNLAVIVSGGAPIDQKYAKGFRDFGITILNGYGITECSPVVAVNRNGYYRDGSVGKVLPHCQVKIADQDKNGHGEILVKGDTVMLGYYKNEQATTESFDGLWFKTGDIGYLDKDGFLYVSGRKKNLIILSNGKNVYPEEIEFDLINNIPYIEEVVVHAQNNILVAEVYLGKNNSDCALKIDSDISIFNKTQVRFKNIGKTIIRDTEFPKTTTKKIKRAQPSNHISSVEKNVSPKTPVLPNKGEVTALQQSLCKIWAEILNMSETDISIEDNFFNIGGDSLDAISVVCEIDRIFNYTFNDRLLHDYSTIDLLAQHITETITLGTVSNEVKTEYRYQELLENTSLIVKPSKHVTSHVSLLTGATGFLGSHLLYDLLHNTDDQIICLVRNFEKYNKTIEYYFDKIDSKYFDRVHLVQGDIADSNLGLSHEEYADLQTKVTRVIHAAADVRHFGDWNQQEQTNIFGTFNLIKFCAEAGASLNHISTMWVSGKDVVQQNAQKIIEFDESMLDIEQKYTENIYVHSKLVAELLVSKYQKLGLKANIIRIGNLMNRAHDGKVQLNTEENGFSMRAQAIKKLGCIPKEFKEDYIDISYVDESARAVVSLLENTHENNNVWHVYNHNLISMYDYCVSKFGPLEVVEMDVFLQKLEEVSRVEKSMNVMKFYLQGVFKANGTKVIFVNNKTVQDLSSANFLWTKP